MMQTVADAIEHHPITEAEVIAGFHVANLLGQPLMVNGGEFYVTDEMLAKFPKPQSRADATASDEWSAMGREQRMCAARAAGWALGQAERFLNEICADMGITPPKPPEDAVPLAAKAIDLAPEPEHEPSAEYRAGQVIVDKRYAVRTDNDGFSWHIDDLKTNSLIEWHPGRQQALCRAVEIAKQNPPPHKDGDSLPCQQ